jgi:hypothetical protein
MMRYVPEPPKGIERVFWLAGDTIVCGHKEGRRIDVVARDHCRPDKALRVAAEARERAGWRKIRNPVP